MGGGEGCRTGLAGAENAMRAATLRAGGEGRHIATCTRRGLERRRPSAHLCHGCGVEVAIETAA